MRKVLPSDAILVPKGAKRVFAGLIFDVYQWQQTLFNGKTKTYEMLKRPDTIKALLIQDDTLLLVEDHQPHQGLKLTLPGGRAEQHDASWLVAAQREVLEETGLHFKNWRLINVRQAHHKIEWFSAVYLAWGISGREKPRHDPGGEKIKLMPLHFDAAKERIMSDGQLQYIRPLFENLHSLDDLRALPEFPGQAVDR